MFQFDAIFFIKIDKSVLFTFIIKMTFLEKLGNHIQINSQKWADYNNNLTSYVIYYDNTYVTDSRRIINITIPIDDIQFVNVSKDIGKHIFTIQMKDGHTHYFVGTLDNIIKLHVNYRDILRISGNDKSGNDKIEQHNK
jgi:hypothetical protein